MPRVFEKSYSIDRALSLFGLFDPSIGELDGNASESYVEASVRERAWNELAAYSKNILKSE